MNRDGNPPPLSALGAQMLHRIFGVLRYSDHRWDNMADHPVGGSSND